MSGHREERLRGFLAELNRTGGTTLPLTTHDLPDVERLLEPPAALISAVAERVAVGDLAVAEPAIEDVVRQLYAR